MVFYGWNDKARSTLWLQVFLRIVNATQASCQITEDLLQQKYNKISTHLQHCSENNAFNGSAAWEIFLWGFTHKSLQLIFRCILLNILLCKFPPTNVAWHINLFSFNILSLLLIEHQNDYLSQPLLF